MKNEEHNNKRDPAPDKQASKRGRPQIAFFIWMLVFIALGVVFFYTQHRKDYAEWDQKKFEEELKAGNVETVNIISETEGVKLIVGEYRIPDSKPVHKLDESENLYRVRVIYTTPLDELLREQNVKREVKKLDAWLKTLIMTILPILILVGLLYFLFSRQIKMAGRGAMQFGKSRARMIFPDEHRVTFKDVAGADEAKEETMEIIDYLKDPLKFKMLGGRIPKGAMLTGPPGTGKTLLAKAIAGEAEVPFFGISGSDFVEMFVGVGASRVRDMFEQTRRHSPCILFIDEIDAVGRSRFSGIGGGHDEREQTLNALLVEMDGLETLEGVIVVAATNRPDVLDPALLRPGRFDRQIVLDLPDINGRKKILEVHAENIKMDSKADLGRIARGTPGFSGADLANLINESALLAARRDKKMTTMEELEEARDKVRWGRERRSRKISERERRLTAYHESGHTLCVLFCPKATPLHKVTIIPRGVAYLGATLNLPDEDKYTMSRNELVDELTVLMGGRAAEELVFGDVTSGAASDIKEATKMARRMVCAFGMSDLLGTVQYGARDEHIYLGRDIVKSEDYSEETAREIDLEIKKIVDSARENAARILSDNRDKLEKLAEKLLECETMEAGEVRKMLDIPDNRGKEEERGRDISPPESPFAKRSPEPGNLS